MKTFGIILMLLLSSTLVTAEESADRLRVGDPVDRMRDMLGEPRGFMETATRAVYYYPRGDVHVENGLVTQLDLISEAALAEQQAEQAAERERLMAEGRRRRAEVLENDLFAGISPAERVKYWERFQATYPGVDVSIPLAKAREEARAEEAEQREERRIVSMEQRLREADRRIERAEAKAERALRDASFERYSYRAAPVVVLPGISKPYPLGVNSYCPSMHDRSRLAVQPGITTSIRGDRSGRFTLSFRGAGIYLNEIH